jgi:hypothetical protein
MLGTQDTQNRTARAKAPANMEPHEPDTHSFVVKVWLEETAEEAGRAHWRGHITHVASGERRYLQSLTEITSFIEGYLMRMGVTPDTGWHWPRWLSLQRTRKS